METITYTNNQGLELKINKFPSGQFKWAFSLTFNNGVHTFCYTMTELRTILLKNGMTRKWAANVKDRFDPLTEEHVLSNRYRIPGGSEMEVFITSRIPFVNMIGTGLDMGYMKPQLLEHKLNQTVLIPGTPTFFSFFNQKIFHFKKFFLPLRYKQKDKTMAITSYINSNGLGLKVTQLPSGTFDLYFSNGFISTCYTEEELQDLIQRKGFQQTK